MEQTSLANEAPWSEEDLAWLKRVQPEELQPIARRYGRRLFVLTWQIGMTNEALGRLTIEAQNISKWGMKRQVQGIVVATNVLQQTTDMMAKMVLAELGLKPENLLECKGDVERIMALMHGAKQAGDRVSKGGIILDS